MALSGLLSDSEGRVTNGVVGRILFLNLFKELGRRNLDPGVQSPFFFSLFFTLSLYWIAPVGLRPCGALGPQIARKQPGR